MSMGSSLGTDDDKLTRKEILKMTDETTETAEKAKKADVDLQKAIGILEPMIEQNASDDEMVIALIQAGFKFAAAGRLMTRALEHKGLKLSSKDRQNSVSELLTTWNFSPNNWKEVEDCVAALVEEIDATSESQAMSCIRKWAKEHNVEIPEKPAQRLSNNFQESFMEWALANRDCTEAELRDFIVKSNAKENQVDKYVAQFGFVLKFARAFAA